MANVSVRQAILAAIQTRLKAIKTGAGFQTDAGDAVFLGETPTLGPGDALSAIAVLAGDDRVKFQGVNVLVQLPVQIFALAVLDATESAWLTVEAMLADIMRAIELNDRLLGGALKTPIEVGTTRTLPREPGSLVVGAVIEYVASYGRGWGKT